jgi:O-antigen ligase
MLTVLCLRVTITEAPPIPLSAKALILADPLYSVLVSCVLFALCAIWWLRRLLGYGAAYRRTGLEFGLGVLFLAALLSTPLASDRRLAINHTLIFFAPALAALILVQLLDRPGRMRLVLIFLIALGILSTVNGFNQFTSENSEMIRQYEEDPAKMLEPLGVTDDPLQRFMFKHRLYTRGVRSYFTTRNSAACFGLISLFAALALFHFKAHGVSKRTALACLGLLGLGLILFRSKASLLGLMAGGMALLLWHRYAAWISRHRRGLTAILLVGGIAGAAAVGLYGSQRGTLPGGQSMTVRWQYWQAAGRMVADHPWLGVGPGNFAPWYQHYKVPEALEAVADPHNLLLSILTQYGPLGLIGLGIVLLGPFWKSAAPSSSQAPTAPGPSRRQQAILTGIALAAALLVLRPVLVPLPPVDIAAVQIYLYVSQRLFPFGLALALVLWLLRPKATGSPLRPPWHAAALCGVLAALTANLTDFAVFEPAVLMGIWFLAACGLARNRAKGNHEAAPPAPRAVALGAGILILTGASIYGLAVRPVTASIDWISQAQQAMERGQYDQAQRCLARAVEADPWSSLAPMTAGSACLAEYEHGPARNRETLLQAVGQFTLATERHPADYRPFERLGHTHALLGNWDQAYSAYLAAAERYPGIARLQVDLGQMAEKRGDASQALVHYRQALSIEDRFRVAFAAMYPEEEATVSRLGVQAYRFALSRIEPLGGTEGDSGG